MSRPRACGQSGFTLVELVVAVTISAIVMVFVSMFIAAPLGAYEAQSQRAALVAGPSDAWPRMEADLRNALPNSVRTRRNGVFVALEMLPVVDVARYMTPAGGAFTVAGTTNGAFRGITLPFDSGTAGQPYYLSVNNVDTASAYSLTGSMSAAGAVIQIAAAALPGEANVTVTPAPVFAGDSPRRRVYLVTGPVAYLCDEGQGTLRRYTGYTLAAAHTSRDSPAELAAAGAASTLVARGLTTCNFAVSAVNATTSQTVAVRLTSTATNGDSVTLLHTSRAEFTP
jgi:prepilin-type N-terminal cleavage/methylation domain-containing protein